MTINLTGKVDDKMVNTLLEGVNVEGPLRVLFCSSGGFIACMEAILHVLWEESDRTELIGYGDLSSAAFVIFFEAACTRTLLHSTTGMTHLQSSSMTMTQAGIPRYKSQQWAYRELKKEKEDWIERHRVIGLTDKELKRMRKGEDVMMTYSRMLELLLPKET